MYNSIIVTINIYSLLILQFLYFHKLAMIKYLDKNIKTIDVSYSDIVN